MWRHHPQTAKIAQIVDEGAIGRLRLDRATFSFQLAATHGADEACGVPKLASCLQIGDFSGRAPSFGTPHAEHRPMPPRVVPRARVHKETRL